MKAFWFFLWVILVCVLIGLGIGSCGAGEKPEIQDYEIMLAKVQQTHDTAQKIRDLEFQNELLRGEVADLVDDLRECRERSQKLENRVYSLERKTTKANVKPRYETAQSTETKLVRSVRGTASGKASQTGDYIWRLYSDGRRTKQYAPLRRVVQRVVQPRRVVASPTYFQPSNMGWSSSFYGGAMCAGGS